MTLSERPVAESFGFFGKADSSGYPELVHFSKDVGQVQARENAPIAAWNQTIEKPKTFCQGKAFTDRDFNLNVSLTFLLFDCNNSYSFSFKKILSKEYLGRNL